MNCPCSLAGRGWGAALHTSAFPGPPPLGWVHVCRLLPTHRGLWQPLGALGSGQRLGPKEREATNAAGDAHLGTWPSCLGGTCDTRCCSWCRCGEDTSQATGTHSGTGNRQEHVCAGTPGPRSAHRCLLLPSEPELCCSWAKALSHKEPTSRGKATQNHDGMTYTMSLAHLVIPEHQKAPLETPQPT